jgi:NAD(P)-dependent dehydrogenase (short-subunit alcohol dehydrogenase family)
MKQRDRSIAGKVALVTGGANGLGAATARQLLARGANVYVADLQAPSHAGAAIDQVKYLEGDVSDRGSMERVVDSVLEATGSLDIVVANAGVISRGSTLRASSPTVADRVLDVNVRGVLNTVHASLPSLIASRGRLALVSSVFAYLNGAAAIPYAMSKAAVEQLGRGLRVEMASHGVSVTTAYFAMINTDMIRMLVDEDPTTQALVDGLPRVLHKRIDATVAAKGIVQGLRRRDPRVVRPRRWVGMSAMRGVLGPLMDARLMRDDNIQALIARFDERNGQDQLTS